MTRLVEFRRCFRKQIARHVTALGTRVTLNKSVVDGIPHFYVCTNGKVVASFRNAQAAKSHFDEKCRSNCAAHEFSFEAYEQQALEIDANKPRKLCNVTFPLLAALNKLTQSKRGRCETHLATNSRLADIVGYSEIPTTPIEFEAWVNHAIDRILWNRKKQSYARQLFRFLMQSFTNMQTSYPTVFENYIPLIPQVRSAILRAQGEHIHRLASVQHFSPLSRREIESMFREVETFDQACLLCIYLGMGFRSGEAEQVRPKHLLFDGSLLIDEIQTKTASRKKKRLHNPQAPLAVKAATTWLDERERIPLPYSFSKKKFRSTFATYSSLAGMPSLAIAARLGHTSRKMSDEFYVRPEFIRVCMGANRNLQDALFLDCNARVIDFRVCGIRREDSGETLWDWYVLMKLVEAANRFSRQTEIRSILSSFLLNANQTKEQIVVSF